MTALSKYIKQPLAGALGNYTDTELRKVELSISTLLANLLELQDMAAAIEVGTFVFSITGLTTTPQMTAKYARSGSVVVIYFPSISGVSNTTGCSLTGIPASITPKVDQGFSPILIQNNSVLGIGLARAKTDGTIDLRPPNFLINGWTAANNKGPDHFNLAFNLE